MAIKGQMYIVGILFLIISVLGIYGYFSYPKLHMSLKTNSCMEIGSAYLNNNITGMLDEEFIFLVRNGSNIDIYESIDGRPCVEVGYDWYCFNNKTTIPSPPGNFSVYYDDIVFVFREDDIFHYICNKKHFYMTR